MQLCLCKFSGFHCSVIEDWCSGVWHCIVGWLVASVVKGSITFMQGSNGLWRIPLKHWEPPAQQHSITSWKTGILKLYFTHWRHFLITRFWSYWYRIAGNRNCSGRTGLCHWVCCQTKCLWVSHPQIPGYTGYVYVNVTHFLCWNCERRSLWLLKTDLTVLRLQNL